MYRKMLLNHKNSELINLASCPLCGCLVKGEFVQDHLRMMHGGISKEKAGIWDSFFVRSEY